MATTRIVKVDYVELRPHLVTPLMRKQVVIGYGGEIGKLKVINEL